MVRTWQGNHAILAHCSLTCFFRPDYLIQFFLGTVLFYCAKQIGGFIHRNNFLQCPMISKPISHVNYSRKMLKWALDVRFRVLDLFYDDNCRLCVKSMLTLLFSIDISTLLLHHFIWSWTTNGAQHMLQIGCKLCSADTFIIKLYPTRTLAL